MIKIYPSILAADFLNLESELRSIQSADGVHIDVMDGHFVPNLTIGLPVVSRICEVASIPTDVHLMIEDAAGWAGRYAAAGATSVTFHIEAAENPTKVIAEIQAAGSAAAVAVKPGTPIQQIEPLLSQVQMILVMTVEPGFGGQALIRETLTKVRWLRSQQLMNRFAGVIQVDGGVNATTIADVTAAGAEVLVAGSAIFASDDRAEAISKLRSLAVSAS